MRYNRFVGNMIFIGADHRGVGLKAQINKWLAGRGLEFEDVGAYEYDHSDDYVDFAVAVAQRVGQSPDRHRGIVICGSGVGVDVVANKVGGVRCGVGWERDQVVVARKDDGINVLALAADNVDEGQALKLVEVFLTTGFVASESHLRRMEKIKRLESGS